MENNLKFTKCECCPYYAKIEEEWKCSKLYINRKCIFDYNDSGTGALSYEVLKIWINANNGFEVK